MAKVWEKMRDGGKYILGNLMWLFLENGTTNTVIFNEVIHGMKKTLKNMNFTSLPVFKKNPPFGFVSAARRAGSS